MKKHSVLFVCIHNSARSQMAEAFANICGEGKIIAESSGLEPGKLNGYVVESMMEKGIDISGNKTKGVAEMLMQKREFDTVITVCDETSAAACPFFPGGGKRLHWSFADPSLLTGSYKEILAETAKIRDSIEQKVSEWIALISE